MKNKILLLISVVLLIGFISACDETNDFQAGEDIMICSGECKYQDATFNYVDCDASVQAYITLSYSDGSLIISNASMSRVGNHYEYNLTPLIDNTASNNFNAKIMANALIGESEPTDFSVSISQTQSASSSPSGFFIGDEIKEAKTYAKTYTEEYYNDKIKNLWIILIILCLFVAYLFFNLAKKGLELSDFRKRVRKNHNYFNKKLNKKEVSPEEEYVEN